MQILIGTDTNRTELKYAVYDGTKWTEAKFFKQDDTADFNPVVTSTSGVASIVWQDINRLITEDEAFEDYLAATELSVAEYSNGTLSGKNTLTNDDYYDFMPAIANSDGKTHLAWVKNKSNNILAPAAGSFEVLYAVNDGSGWSTPIVLETGLNQVADLDLAANGSELTIVYNLDEDGDIFTSEDWEVYAKQASDGNWLPTVKLTTDEIQDNQQHIKTIFYDSNVNQWSKPVIITSNDYVNSEIAAAITANNEMAVINKAKEKIVEEIEGVQYSNLGAANIVAHTMKLAKDLKVVEDTLSFAEGFISDADNEMKVGIENCGEFTVNSYDVAFYDGNMDQIALTSVQTPLLPGEKTVVSADWLAPETVSSPDITVTVDPDDEIGDSDKSNIPGYTGYRLRRIIPKMFL